MIPLHRPVESTASIYLVIVSKAANGKPGKGKGPFFTLHTYTSMLYRQKNDLHERLFALNVTLNQSEESRQVLAHSGLYQMDA